MVEMTVEPVSDRDYIGIMCLESRAVVFVLVAGADVRLEFAAVHFDSLLHFPLAFGGRVAEIVLSDIQWIVIH